MKTKKNVLNIGTAGGWTKASTGYTFANSSKKTKDLVGFIKNSNDLRSFKKKSKHQLYDLLFLDVLSQNNALGSKVFSSMFERVNVQTILKFLDEDSTLLEDLKIILSVPSIKFSKALFKRITSL